MKPPNPPNQPTTADSGVDSLDDTAVGPTDAESMPETRTTGSDGHPGERLCQRCSGPIKGRRRNGYCSDACRMQDHRDEEHETLDRMLGTLESLVGELRAQ